MIVMRKIEIGHSIQRTKIVPPVYVNPPLRYLCLIYSVDWNLEGGKKRSLFPEENKLVLLVKYPVEGVFLFWESNSWIGSPCIEAERFRRFLTFGRMLRWCRGEESK